VGGWKTVEKLAGCRLVPTSAKVSPPNPGATRGRWLRIGLKPLEVIGSQNGRASNPFQILSGGGGENPQPTQLF